MTELTKPDPYRPSLPPESAVPETAPPDPFLGKTIDGRYFIESILGEGGIGIVYLARHRIIGKAVAIKVLRRDMARDDAMTERFLLEAQAVSGIGNPHIIDISDFGTLPDGSRYFVMEYLPGQSLADLIEKVHPLPVPRLLAIAKQIASGLGAAHDAGIVHRDIKPDNIILLSRPSPTSGGAPIDFVKIFDFGIALVGGRASRLTVTGAIFGSPRYMSPEQCAGQQVDHRADIYALGVMLYEMACGQVPFDAENVMVILGQQLHKAPVPLLARVPPPAIPPLLDAIIMKCLSKDVLGRYGSMKELIGELERVERELENPTPSDVAAPPPDAQPLVQAISLAPPTQRDAPEATTRARVDSDIPIPLTRLTPAPMSVASVPRLVIPASEPVPSQSSGWGAAPKRSGGWKWGALVLGAGVAGLVFAATHVRHTDAAVVPRAAAASIPASPSPPPPKLEPAVLAEAASAPAEAPWLPASAAPSSRASASPSAALVPEPLPRSGGHAVHVAQTASPSAPAPPPVPALDCDPPYTFDAQHHKHYKRECPL